ALSRAMLAGRSELKFLEAQRVAREYARDSIRGGYFPSIDLSVAHSRFGETSAFEGLPDPLFDSDTRGTVETTWNLFEGWRTKNDILAEESEIRAITERIRETRDALLLQLKTAVEEYRVSAGRIELSNKGVEQAEENYRITENQFRERVATSTDLLDARVFLTRARNEYNNAVYNLSLSLATLERVVEGPVETGPSPGEQPGN
ncbi:MAG: TolC family protein, partial [Candidatus Deferrimicrobiaceae bacterium]